MMKFKYLLLATLISQPVFASEQDDETQVDLAPAMQTPLTPTRDDLLVIEVQGNQYRSSVQIDLSDPNLILVIDNDAVEAQQGDTEELLESELSEEAAELDEETALTLDREAECLALRLEAKEAAAKGDYEQALKLLDQALPLAEQPAQVLATKGSVLYKLKDMPGAIQAWKKALAIDPSMTEVSEMLKWLEK
ncbi:tetratricopeptide repeat protein [Vibrio sp. SCSIO 43136]|uniref:tetratricopeptide repeat protein n=1 Tax=Vibrio sp. SCSIO 43136 TaxID=2819101 RepID=UPI0020765912|nr:tetratricopeptide repeat protein [Vibrio sp. SCSIO 43136]USD67920.1 hypothetical protein J4N39_17200 [Vibrio sp. SCSIO 43136]